MPDLRNFCVPRRCAACRMKFNVGDEIVVVGKITGLELSRELPFCDPDNNINHKFCYERGQCPHPDPIPEYAVVVCHPECLALVPPELRCPLFETTSYGYQPPAAEDERRVRWLRHTWASILYRKYLIPLELCDHIGQYCLRSFAVLCGLAYRSTRSRHPPPSHVSFLTKIWARHTLFEGLSYVLCLTNEQPTEHDTGKDGTRMRLVFDPESAHRKTAIFLAEDHIGAREVLFSRSDQRPTIKGRPIKERQNVWWRSAVVPPPDMDVDSPIYSRRCNRANWMIDLSVYLDRHVGNRSKQTLWAFPRPPASEKRLHDFEGWSSWVMKMVTLRLNDPDIIGYSVCRAITYDCPSVAMHAHTRGEDMAFYQRENIAFYPRHRSDRFIWHYMPVDSGEVVVEVWMHKDTIAGMGLMFKTNKGRLTLMGWWPAAEPLSNWTLFERPSPGPGRIFWENSARGIRSLGSENPEPAPSTEPPPLLMPLTESPRWALEQYCYSSATLDGITMVTPSLHREVGVCVITGLLLHHTNDHTSCVGQGYQFAPVR